MSSQDFGPRSTYWVVGAGGFLGSALGREIERLGHSQFPARKINWTKSSERAGALKNLAHEFSIYSGESKPTIIWAAGSSGVGSSQPEQLSEVASFTDFAHSISTTDELAGATVVVVSSAGGVYSGSKNPPFTISSHVNAINDYGRDKIRIEEIANRMLAPRCELHIARVTNLYGPWPGPRQGLINRLCTAASTREALQIYVPLDTTRDYIYVDDAARILLAELDSTTTLRSPDSPSLALVGSGQNSPIGEVINTVAHVTHRRVPVTFARLETTELQPGDLRMQPSWLDRGLDFSPLTLPQGTKRLFDLLVSVPRWGVS